MNAQPSSVPSAAHAPAAAVDVTLASLDKPGADAAIERARRALGEARVADAREAFKEALECHPGIMDGYREIGLLLVELGLGRAAEQCFRGTLAEPLCSEWFGPGFEHAVPGSAVGEGDTGERHVCHEPRTRPLRAPKGIEAPRDGMFRRSDMTSTVALVDRLPGGSLWFDGFNRVALDAEGRSVLQHERGNPSLVRALTERVRPHHVPGRAFFVGNRGYSNYYHWMLDILPSMRLFEQAGQEFGPDDRVVVFTGASRFQKATLAHLGFDTERVVQMGRTSPWVSADEMVVPYFANSMALSIGDWVPEFLQERFVDGAPTGSADAVPTPARIYLARAKNARNGRSIGNEAELIPWLEARGFTTVYPENYTVFEQARLFSRAETVLAPHGAGLTNIVFCRPGTKVVELYGNFIATCYWALSEVCGLDYYNHCCSLTERSVHYHERSQKDLHELRQRGFSVDLDELAALLEEVERA